MLAFRAAAVLERRSGPGPAARFLRTAAAVGGRDAVVLQALAAEATLRGGAVPHGLPALRTRLAAAADRALQAGDRVTLTDLLIRLAAVTFHRVEHLDGPGTPLAADPAAFLAALRTSPAWRQLVAPGPAPHRARPGKAPLRAGPGDRPVRVTVVVDADRRFLDPLLPHLGPDVVIDVVSLAAWDGPALPLTPGEQVRARLEAGGPDAPWAAELRRRLEGADVVWVEWCQRAAVLVGCLRLQGPAVVVRLHSFEAFTVFPHLLDPAQVDALVTVSPALAGLVSAVVPALADRVRVQPNALDPRPFHRPKGPGAATTLGLLGWGSPAKDACWALDVLAELRRVDPRWRLRLIGPAPDRRTAGSRRYADAVLTRADRPDVRGHVDTPGPTDDVPAALAEVGALVSSSTRESFHLAVGEAVASGARVAVRDWPVLAAYGGPRGVWPQEWIASTPAQAAAILLDTEPQAAADRSPEVVALAYRDLLVELASLAGRPRPDR